MSDLFFVQMSGVPGSGKSTLARAIASKLNAVVIDHDVTKPALMEIGLDFNLAGRASYQVLKAIAEDLLEQQHSVIVDSPCLYDDLLTFGQNLADLKRAKYGYIECVVVDMKELDRRLRSRSRKSSQISGIRQNAEEGDDRLVDEETAQHWIENMKRPKSAYLRLDSTQPLDDSVRRSMEYLLAR